MTSQPPNVPSNSFAARLTQSVGRLWQDESATPSGRTVKLATAVITLLGATGVASQLVQ